MTGSGPGVSSANLMAPRVRQLYPHPHQVFTLHKNGSRIIQVQPTIPVAPIYRYMGVMVRNDWRRTLATRESHIIRAKQAVRSLVLTESSGCKAPPRSTRPRRD